MINLQGQTTENFWISLTLLGVGWNFLFTGGTTLLTTTYRPSEKARAQGLNDFVVYSVISLTAVGSGGFHAWFGWQALNVGVTPFLVLAAALVVWLRLRGARRPRPVLTEHCPPLGTERTIRPRATGTPPAIASPPRTGGLVGSDRSDPRVRAVADSVRASSRSARDHEVAAGDFLVRVELRHRSREDDSSPVHHVEAGPPSRGRGGAAARRGASRRRAT